jgi:hypothetical protein
VWVKKTTTAYTVVLALMTGQRLEGVFIRPNHKLSIKMSPLDV